MVREMVEADVNSVKSEFITWVAEFLVALPIIARKVGAKKPSGAVRLLKKEQPTEVKTLAAEFVRSVFQRHPQDVYNAWILRGQEGGVWKVISGLIMGSGIEVGNKDSINDEEWNTSKLKVQAVEAEAEPLKEFHFLKTTVVIQFFKLAFMPTHLGLQNVRSVFPYLKGIDPKHPLAKGSDFVYDLFNTQTIDFVKKWLGGDPVNDEMKDLLPYFTIPKKRKGFKVV